MYMEGRLSTDITKKTLGPVVPDAIALEDEEVLSRDIWHIRFRRLYSKVTIHRVASNRAKG